MPERSLVALDVQPGVFGETQSGLQMLRPRIFGALEEAAPKGPVAAVLMHPNANFLGHYLITPLAERGIACLACSTTITVSGVLPHRSCRRALALNSRYLGNDAGLLMERVLLDLGAGVRYLREQGYRKVILIGNSGGGALSAFYQAEAEHLTIDRSPAGDPIAIHPTDLPPVDGIAFCAAHTGRSRLFADWLDGSMLNEHDLLGTDPELDMYNPDNGPPYSAEFLKRYSIAQRARRERIEAWVWGRLRMLRAAGGPARDEAFVVHRIQADPRILDLTLDPNDRAARSVWGEGSQVNFSPNAMARYTTLTGFLSQWASCSRADGPTNIARTTIPTLFLEYTADASAYPSSTKIWMDAMQGRAAFHPIRGGDHYLTNRPDLVAETAEQIASWASG